MAKKKGVSGWHSMRKDQLVRALVRVAKAQASAKAANGKSSRSKTAKASSTRATSTKAKRGAARKSTAATKVTARNGSSKSTKTAANGKSTKNGKPTTNGQTGGRRRATPVAEAKPARPVNRRIKKAIQKRDTSKDLTTSAGRRKPLPMKETASNVEVEKDRIILLVRDPYWLQAVWDLSRHSVDRAKAAMAEHWHTAKPVLRLYKMTEDATTNTAESVDRDIEIHGSVTNWYIDVKDPPESYRVALGYLTTTGRFYCLARSNSVTTPAPGSSDAMDEHWSGVLEDYEKVYAMSGGYDNQSATGELKELFEERLRRPMGTPLMTQYGVGADAVSTRRREFDFAVDAEMIIYGTTKPHSHVAMSGEPIKLRPDGTFTIRMSLPDKRQVLPIVASSADGVEQRTIVLAVERNTKIMEPLVKEASD